MIEKPWKIYDFKKKGCYIDISIYVVGIYVCLSEVLLTIFLLLHSFVHVYKVDYSILSPELSVYFKTEN